MCEFPCLYRWSPNLRTPGRISGNRCHGLGFECVPSGGVGSTEVSGDRVRPPTVPSVTASGGGRTGHTVPDHEYD